MNIKSYLYAGTVGHSRFAPKQHHFKYRVFSLFLDIDELDVLNEKAFLFGYNRWAPISFYNKDHGPRTGSALRPWVEAKLLEENIECDGGAIKLLCHGRTMGFGFTPLSVYFCFKADKTLLAILYEVCNTHFERHTYVIAVNADSAPVIRQECAKKLYVSPFNDMSGQYEFLITRPEKNIKITVNYKNNKELLLSTYFSGRRLPFTGYSLLKCSLLFPLLSFKIFFAIHWEAIRLWSKRVKVYKYYPTNKSKLNH